MGLTRRATKPPDSVAAPTVTEPPAPSRLADSGLRRAPKVVVIGAGIGGLATAVRCLARGMDVTVVEGQSMPGGRAGQIRDSGFTFDTGPSLVTMPELIDDLFRVAGTSTAQELRLRRLDPFYRIVWEGEDENFLFSGDRDAMISRISRFDEDDGGRYDAYLVAGRKIYEAAILGAGRTDFLRLGSFVKLVPDMARLGALRSVEGFVARFFRDPHMRQAFEFHSLFIGGAPSRVPAVYAALAYLQIAGGVWYAEGGLYSLVEALSRIVAAGGRLRLGSAVSEISCRDGRVRGVLTDDGEFFEAEYVVSNADAVQTQRLLRRRSPSPKLTMSCYLLYLGAGRIFPQLDHHTLLVGRGYHDFIRQVTVDGGLPENVSLYVHAPCRTDVGMAPAGGDSLTILVPVPNLSHGHDWSRAAVPFRERVLDALESDQGLGLRGLRDAIVIEHSWTPRDYQDRLGATDGNAFGPEPSLLQSAYFRQPNRDRKLGGMYYVGAGTHPGAGIPGVLLTAEVTCRLLGEEVFSWR